MAKKYKLVPIITIILFLINVIQLITITSDTGSKTMTYFFGQLNTIVCLLLGYIVYHRYHQIKQLICQHTDLIEMVNLNRKAGYLGFLMCLSYGIVSAFLQEYQYIINSIGILVFFFPSTMYFLWQYEITLKIQSYIGSMELTCLRMNFALSCEWMLKIFFTTKIIWIILVFGNYHDLQWIIGFIANTECVLLIVAFVLYILTFVSDLEIENFQSVTV